MSDSKGQAQSSTHVSGTAYSDDDDFECFFNEVESKFTNFQPHPTAVSILTDPNRNPDGKDADNRVESQQFTLQSISVMENHIPKNTTRNTDTALFRFAAFYVTFLKILSPQSVKKMNGMDTPAHTRKSLKEQAVSLTNLSLFRLNDGNLAAADVSLWPEYLLERLNHALIEFLAHIKQ